jgi:hypothetical protein
MPLLADVLLSCLLGVAFSFQVVGANGEDLLVTRVTGEDGFTLPVAQVRLVVF